MTPAGAKPRGRPRNAKAREAVLRVARELLEERGAASVTMERLAERSGVGKPTIYRSWANRHEVVMAALMPASEPTARNRRGSEPARPPLEAWRRQIREVVKLFGSAPGRGVALLLASADADSEIARAFRNHFLEARRQEGRKLLLAAIAEGSVRPDIDPELVLDLVYGPILYRLLMQHKALDTKLADRLLDHLLRGIAA